MPTPERDAMPDERLEVPENDLAEDVLEETGEEEDLEGLDLEAPEADAAEQRAAVLPRDEGLPEEVPDHVDPADLADQRRTVELDDEDYR